MKIFIKVSLIPFESLSSMWMVVSEQETENRVTFTKKVILQKILTSILYLSFITYN